MTVVSGSPLGRVVGVFVPFRRDLGFIPAYRSKTIAELHQDDSEHSRDAAMGRRAPRLSSLWLFGAYTAMDSNPRHRMFVFDFGEADSLIEQGSSILCSITWLRSGPKRSVSSVRVGITLERVREYLLKEAWPGGF